MNSKYLGAVAIAAAAAVALSACTDSTSTHFGGDSAQSAEQQSSQSGAGSPQSSQSGQGVHSDPAATKKYFEALASDDSATITLASEHAAPDSPAQDYLTYKAGVAASNLQAGFRVQPEELLDMGTSFEICPAVISEQDPCEIYADFEYKDGKLFDFTQDGKQLSGRVLLKNQTETFSGGGAAELIAAYQTVEGDLVAVFRVEAPATSVWVDADYQTPNGNSRQASSVYGAESTAADEVGTYSFYFDESPLGGVIDLEVELYSGDGQDSSSSEQVFSFPLE